MSEDDPPQRGFQVHDGPPPDTGGRLLAGGDRPVVSGPSSDTDDRPLAGDAPDALVSNGAFVFGSWTGIPAHANLLDADKPYHSLLLNLLKRLRLKEWQAIQAGDDEWFICAVLYDAKLLSLTSIDLWDRVNGKKYGFRHVSLGSRFTMPESLYPSDVLFHAPDKSISIRMHPEDGHLGLKAACRPKQAETIDLALDFSLSEEKCAPFSVCLPLGISRAMYSTKILMPCSGTLNVAGYEHRFDGSRASGILDNHKGYYPYRLHYDWVTGFGIDASGQRVGFNLTDNQVKDQARYNENRLWIGREIYPLPPVKMTRPYGRESPWIIQDTEGMVDLVFKPEAGHDIEVNLGIIVIDYHGPFGSFEGFIASPEGHKIDVRTLYGMGEDKSLRL